MLENFIEYMWYLLTTPFKRVKKTINAWYIWCRVLGGWFDECKEDLFKARDNGMVATCEELMLNEHAEERRLTRYAGEETENFRSRIAMYEEICKLGGTNEGLLLVARTLGYKNVTIKSAIEFRGDAERWAEFYIIMNMQVEERHPIGFDIFKKEIRKWKEVGAKENYLFEYQNKIVVKNLVCCSQICGKKINNVIKNNDKIITGTVLNINEQISFKMIIYNDLWYLDGTYNLDGTKRLDAYVKEIKI